MSHSTVWILPGFDAIKWVGLRGVLKNTKFSAAPLKARRVYIIFIFVTLLTPLLCVKEPCDSRGACYAAMNWGGEGGK